VLSMRDLYFFSLGGIIGSAWLFGSLYGASDAGPSAIVSWLIAGVLIIFIALTWAEIGGMIPSTGAAVRAPRIAHGDFTGFYFGWAYYIAAVTVPPVETIAIVTYAATYVPGLTRDGSLAPGGYAVSMVLMVIMLLLNAFGVKLLARFNDGLTIWKIAIPSLTAVVALLYFYPPNFTAYGGFTPYGSAPIFSTIGSAGIMLAYSGFRGPLDYSGEARNAKRDVPRAIIFSVLTAIAIYTVLQLSFIGGIRWGLSGVAPGDWSALATSSAYSSAPFYTLLSVLGLSAIAIVLLVDAAVSPFGAGNVYTGSSARDLFALAEGVPIPNAITEVHKDYGVPRKSLLVSFAIGILFILVFPSWGPLATVVTATTVFTYLAGATSLTVLRRSAPDLARSFRLPAARVLSPVAFVFASLVVYWTTWPYTAYSFIAILSGLVLFFYTRRGRPIRGTVRSGIWVVAYSISIVVLSFFGSYGDRSIPFPSDFGLVTVVSLVFYYWGIRDVEKGGEIRVLLSTANP
jgi:amino acid transporter